MQRPRPHPSAHPSTSRTSRTLYLTVYNTLFASLWSTIFYLTISHLPSTKLSLFTSTSPLARRVQTFSLIEIAHAALGIIPSPVSTTTLQVVTRVIQVWMVWYSFPASTASSYAYGALVLAWSVADAARYVYLVLNMWGMAPEWLVWVRYTMFYVLYPIGIGAEWWLLYRATPWGGEISAVIPPLFYFCLVLYVPGAYTMYTYMIKQRSKALRKGTRRG